MMLNMCDQYDVFNASKSSKNLAIIGYVSSCNGIRDLHCSVA